MSGRPRIAVALFGLPRCSAVTGPSIEQNLLRPLRQCGDVRVFYHLFLQDRIDNPRTAEAGELDRSNYDLVQGFEGRLEPPPPVRGSKQHRLMVQKGDFNHDDGISLANWLLQLHSLAAVWELAQAHDPDVVVFARPDLLYHDPMDRNVVRHALRKPRVCALPNWQWYRGCNDRLAICGRAAAPVYAGRGTLLEEYCRQSAEPIQSEALLRYALVKAGVSVVAIPLQASRVRLGGQVRAELFHKSEWWPHQVLIYKSRYYGCRLLGLTPPPVPPTGPPPPYWVLQHLWRARLAHALIRRH